MQTSRLTAILLGAVLLAAASGCCKPNCPKTIKPISTPAGWTEVSEQSPKGTIVSLALPEGWEDITEPRPLIARKATTATNGFYTRVIVVVDLFNGTLDGYVKANKRVLADEARITSERPVRLGDRDAYELGYEWPGPSQSSALQIIELVEEEAISVTCSTPRRDDEALSALCNKVFGTYSVTLLPP